MSQTPAQAAVSLPLPKRAVTPLIWPLFALAEVLAGAGAASLDRPEGVPGAVAAAIALSTAAWCLPDTGTSGKRVIALTVLMAIGLGAAFAAGPLTGAIGLLLTLASVCAAAAVGRRSVWLMAAFHAFTFLLGLGLSPARWLERGYLLVIPFAYVWAMHALRRGNDKGLAAGVVLFATILGALLGLVGASDGGPWQLVPFWILWAGLVGWPLKNALWDADVSALERMQVAGWLAWPVACGAIAAAFSGWQWGVMAVVVWPLAWVAYRRGLAV